MSLTSDQWSRDYCATGVNEKKYRANKYHFEELSIGESKTFLSGEVKEHNLRGAATFWGYKYGFWLRVTKCDDGYLVTRLDCQPSRKHPHPIVRHKVKECHYEDRLKRIEDGIKFLSIMLVKVKAIIEEIQDKIDE